MASPETSSSLKFLFFMFAFTIAVPLTMLLLASLRPLLPMESAWARALVLLPLVNGIWAGRRSAAYAREDPALSRALAYAFGLRRRR
ncbi:MAG: hypothetical protein VYD19_07040 [Myxococcota bacterium]|nr:hypothetical protein [Myxococcota bacterium]